MYVVLVVVAVVAATAVGMASAQRAQPTATVDSCRVIDTPGKYVLSQNITGNVAGADESCIEITASNVVLDGAGHTIAGIGSGHGVEVDGSERAVTNVTVKRLHASNWSVGIFYLGADNGTVQNTLTTNNTGGLALGQANGNELVANTAYDNAIGVALGGESQNNTIRRMVAVENRWGIHFERESGNNTVRNSVARNNTRWDFYSERNEYENTVNNLQLSTATISFSGKNIALRSVTSPPPLPRGTENLDTYVEVSRTRGGPASLSLTIHYESTNDVSLLRHNGQYWSGVVNTRVDASANTISANLSEFGLFAVLADAPNSDGGPVTVTTEPISVQRTLTPVPQSTQTPTPNDSRSAPSNASTAMASRTPAALSETPSNTSTETTAVANSENDAITSTFGIGPVRLFFVVLGLVALVGLALVAVRERAEDGRSGFNR